MNGFKRLTSGGGLMLAATALGLVTAVAAFIWLDQEAEDRAGVEGEGPRLSVVVAREDVPAGATLTSVMLETRELPESLVVPGAETDPEGLLGRVTRYPLTEGEQVLASRLVGNEESSSEGLAFSVPPGMRAVSVPLSEVTGAGGLLAPGDRVDVLVSTTYARLFGPFELVTPPVPANSPNTTDDNVSDHPTVVTALQNVLVLAVAQEITPPLDDERDPATLRPADAEPQPEAGSVTLAVTPEQAQTLLMASQHGVLGLALRGFGDTDGATIQPLFQLEPLAPTPSGLASNN